MLDFTSVLAVLPASDLARARAFYTEKLGFEPEETDETGSVYAVAGGRFLLYETPNAGTAKNTSLSLETTDLEATMAEMRERGIEFEEYDFPGLKTVDGIADMGSERGAWFVDTEGNIIAVAQRVAPSA